ncbi:kinase [Pseudoalteromonas sp. A25]|uniref:kinase n=1 Tax=Pseudoalteromonas sp. A25 TaxID=116092 RepID=UPI0012A33189|nr:kinase [Pseudoalteromonas sp. A25]BBN82144.1 kinase [Pseudoalteromonas sp. A25]
MQQWQRHFLDKHQLFDTYLSDAEAILYWLRKQLANRNTPYCFAINGAQGSGKSTLARYITRFLCHEGYKADHVSLDDFYLSQKERRLLAEQYHALFVTRGVPGTHNVAHAKQVIEHFKKQLPITLPRFDKGLDEPSAKHNWHQHSQPLNVLIFEGWCVGLAPQLSDQLITPINEFEQLQDKDGQFRGLVNQFLKDQYQTLFAQLDGLIYLDIGSFERVYRWRLQQEQQLKARTGQGMSGQQVKTFIQFFQRLTMHGLASLPNRADLHVKVASDHRFILEK